jgi:hypothetical protein
MSMVGQVSDDDLDPVLQEMQRVLEAERAGQAEIKAAQARAQAISGAARERARAIGERTTARLARLNIAMAAKLDAEVAGLKRTFEQKASATREIDLTSLAAAARVVAAKLTSDAE